MSKRIVVCTDGTWDTTSNNTNVYKVSKSSIISAEQAVYYDDGVGSDGTPIEKLLGGAFGLGLFQKIKDAYTQVSHLYDKDDEIFLFGFSRGAYTARSLAGMIAICGLPTEDFDSNMVDLAFNAYRNKDQRDALLKELNSKYAMYDAKITMVGVWDTVGSLGIPAAFGGVSPLLYGFLDTTLHPDVLNAYQALAIDERRIEFPPTLWTSQPAPGQTMEQVWFTGVHCDIGGGYPDDQPANTALSDITLSWMMSKAWKLGLQSDPAFEKQFTNPDAKLSLDTAHESWSVLWGFPKSRSIAADSSLSNSVAIRCQNMSSYRPGNLKLQDGVPSAGYRMVPIVGPQAEAAGV